MNPPIFMIGCDPAENWLLGLMLFLTGAGLGIFLAALVTARRPS